MTSFFTKKRIVIIAVSVVLIIAIAIGVVWSMNKFFIPNKQYKNAMKLLENGEYAKAANIIYDLGDYKDCKELLKNFTFFPKSEICEYADGKTGYINYEYDGNNDLISISNTYYGRTVVSEYKNGLKIKETVTNDDFNLSDVTVFEYDNNNLIKEETEYASGDQGLVTYEYNSKGLLVKKSQLYNDKVVFDYYYSYDANNNLISESYGSIVIEYEYDDNNNRVRVLTSDRTYASENVDVDEYIYDENGNLVKEILLNDSDVNEYEYDNDGKVTLKINFNRADNTSPYYENDRTTYEYDEFGNLVKEVCSPVGDWDFNYYSKEISYIVFYNQ